ncbi:hypothetical protein BWI97_04090 [Siphonobacter sp. BAB-5405]|uniref:sialate O-acetylesterase n=1 Tax=Siphonobacter sp. BAB-5405 TaxID=1864825 RepID=UPI000C804382|nr:sialate O-acetylesterase [Siphonobacter sp. BAB-5405]PMD98348.1 hypothetical protein BWI97_04090 [Siphonobacter sp. BAB-5405]
MKLFFTWIFSIASLGTVLGQVTFSKLPADNQLFPRNEQSEGTVAIAGTVTDASVTKISVQIFRGSNLYRYASQNLSFQNGRAFFALNPTIKAETVQYQAKIYLVKNRDSTLYATRVNLVAGDVYLISGQSNAVAGGEGPEYILYDPQQNEFCRTYTTNYGSEGPKWVVANGLSVNVGVWGTELQRLIRQNNQIPTCILNNGSGGQPITFFNDRNAANPSDLTTDYGRALHRSMMAGVQNQVKAIFWRQGEAEIGGLSSQMLEYPAQFDKLYRSWKQDYPVCKRYTLRKPGFSPPGWGIDRPLSGISSVGRPSCTPMYEPLRPWDYWATMAFITGLRITSFSPIICIAWSIGIFTARRIRCKSTPPIHVKSIIPIPNRPS